MTPSAITSISLNSPVNSAVKLLQLNVLPACHLPNVGYSSDKLMYKFLAESQRTAIEVITIHTRQEIVLFNRLISDRRFQFFSSDNATIPSFDLFANILSQFCNEGNNIIYKLPENLKSHFNILEDRRKCGESVSLNIVTSREVRNISQSEARYTGSSPANTQPLTPPPQIAMQNHSNNYFSSLLSIAPNLPPPTPQYIPLSSLYKAIKRKQISEKTCRICGQKGCIEG